MAYFEVGYGQLFPMVKRYDYEKALRIYEQEQKRSRFGKTRVTMYGITELSEEFKECK